MIGQEQLTGLAFLLHMTDGRRYAAATKKLHQRCINHDVGCSASLQCTEFISLPYCVRHSGMMASDFALLLVAVAGCKNAKHMGTQE
jgi:hypothetical protein